MELNGRVAIITGGASGIGEATARAFVASGASVVIFDINRDRGQHLVEELGEHALYCRVDVTDAISVTNGIKKTLDVFGAIHICVNYAGVSDATRTVGPDGAFPLDLFRKVMDVNLVGTFNVLRLVAIQMAKNEPQTDDGCRGVIINTASIAACEGQVGQVAYSASKAGVIGLTLPVARDLARSGIRCNAIAPGVIDTPFVESLSESYRRELSDNVLSPARLGKPEEVAHLARFIVENDYLNGECIRLDGGIRM